MSQKPQYICDGCGKPIGEKPHLSLVFNNGGACGVAVPPSKKQTYWAVSRLDKNFQHFHNGKCISAWADALITKALGKKVTTK